MIRVGCSGWNYAHWRNGVFYPPRLASREWLSFYARHFDTVEVNTTFYRLPKETSVARWVKDSPEGFAFAVKVSRYVTHVKRLLEVGEHLPLLYDRIRPLLRSPKLGPLLWQLPPTFRCDVDRLAAALEHTHDGYRHAFEFRHPSWFREEVYTLLREHNVALVIGDRPEVRAFQTQELTADFTFVRFHYGSRGRGGNYSRRELDEWSERLKGWSGEADVFAYFNNDWEGFAIENALYMKERLGQSAIESVSRRPLRYARSMVSREDVLAALGRVIDPELRRPVTELGMVRGIEIEGGEVTVTIALTVVGCPLRSSFEDQVREHVATLPGVSSVGLHFDVMSPDERAELTTKLRGGVEEKTLKLSPRTRVIAVASGKGGVGKSSLTVNLAAALAAQGQEVGILDADIYGHSIPHMLGIDQKPVVVDKMIVPPVAHDMRLMSIGFFLEDNQPVMWRGPMLHRALEQFLQDVHWGEIDTLVVDMPPGTGDISISLGQLLPRAEAVVVTTPQPLAQEVASRAATMAQKTGMRIVGVIENMTSDVFGSGGGERLAAELGVPLLGTVPLDAALREAGDSGIPFVLREPDSTTAQQIVEIAHAIDNSRAGGFTRTLPLVS